MMVKQKHQQLFDLLKTDFQHGQWPLGHKLPSVKELARQYSVSVNVASQAVELLKEARFVRAKKGDGIYSTFAGSDLVKDRRYAGERLYGRYRSAKHLTVFVEDSEPFHVEFWSHALEDFTKHHNDIELNVYFNSHNEGVQHPEIAIGGRRFLAALRTRMPRLLAVEPWMQFTVEEYANTLLPDTDLTAGCLPIGFNIMQLLAKHGTPPPESDENGVHYVQRLSKSGKGGYVLLSMHDFLTRLGCPLCKLGQDGFSAKDRQMIVKSLELIKPLYETSALLWFHGQILGPVQKAEMLAKGQATAVEFSSNLRQQFPVDKEYDVLPCPAGGRPYLHPVFAQISAQTLFPEECLRLVKWLLTTDVQRRAMRHSVFCPLQTELLKKQAQNNQRLAPLLSGHCHWLSIHPSAYFDVQELFTGWEILAFLEGKRTSQETIDLLNHKIRHYYQNQIATSEITRSCQQGVPQ